MQRGSHASTSWVVLLMLGGVACGRLGYASVGGEPGPDAQLPFPDAEIGSADAEPAPADGAPGGTVGIASASAGFVQSCGVSDGGALWCWGVDNYGSLGTGAVGAIETMPVRLGDGWGVVTTQGMWDTGRQPAHTCGFRSASELWCWGSNMYGEIGAGTAANLTVPTLIDVGPWSAFDLGGMHTCAIRTDGSLWCWGRNTEGQLGTDSRVSTAVVARTGMDTDWRSVACGGTFTCGLRTDDSLWCWGNGDAGQLGTGTRQEQVPIRVGMDRWRLVATGELTHSCGIQIDGSLWCWGANEHGQLGIDSLVPQSVPTRVGTGTDWDRVSAGARHSCGVRADGSLWCWGFNGDGQLAQPPTVGNQLVPTPVAASMRWRDAVAGHDHSCALRDDATLWCWGRSRAVGAATPPGVYDPVQVMF